MNIKDMLIIIIFMMFLVNFVPRANASIIEGNIDTSVEGALSS